MKTRTCLSFLLMASAIVIFLFHTRGQDDIIMASVVAGQKAPAFQTKSIDGKTVNFPDDYKGKVVLLDFWATWCAPCREELTNVVTTYQRYHTNGFDVVSVSLDAPKQEPSLQQFIHDHGMTWPQIYDGGYLNAAVAVEYGVYAVPCPVVVDGDTGKILAVGVNALGDRLDHVVGSALAAKAKKQN